MSFKAFHGTPHSFDKFDISKVGSGESTQWFGWGIYLTDSKDIADWYSTSVPEKINQKNKNIRKVFLKGTNVGDAIIKQQHGRLGLYEFPVVSLYYKSLTETLFGENNFKFFEPLYDLIRKMEIYFQYNDNRWITDEDIEKSFNEHYRPEDNDDVTTSRDTYFSTIKNLKREDFKFEDEQIKKTYRYDVTVNKNKTPDQYDFLSWYDELTPNQKQKIVNQIKTEKLKKNVFYIVKSEDDETNVQPKFFKTQSEANSYKKSWNERHKIKLLGVGIDQLVIEKGSFSIDDLNGTVKDFYIQLCGLLGDPKEASMFLLRSGIDGIKYPSNTIAGGESKGMNYVVFDDKSIDIDKRDEREL